MSRSTGDASAMVDESALTATVHATASELGVERVEDIAADTADLQLTEQRHDVVPDEAVVPVARRGLDVDDLEVTIDQLSDRHRGPRLAPGIDLGQQPGADLLCLSESSIATWCQAGGPRARRTPFPEEPPMFRACGVA